MSAPPPDNRLQPDHAPTPFSADDIRAGSSVGKTLRIRSEVPGETPTFRVVRFVEVDEEGAVQEFQPTDANGEPVGDAVRRRSSWLDLQRHASQPASETVIDEVDLVLPFGLEACWRYTVGGEGERRVLWFAKGLPGMPVQVEEWAGDELRQRSVMIERRVGP